MKILLETSARHIHLTQETLEFLCGKNFKLVEKRKLSQPGQFVSETRIDIVGVKNTIKNVSVLGPVRNINQIEISATDARNLGIKVPIRESGDIINSAPIILKGSINSIKLNEGLIIAKRHIHMSSDDAKKINVINGEIVNVKVNSNNRSVIFGDTVVRINDNFCLAMHIDTDEANAANITSECKNFGEIFKKNEKINL